ncbi:NADH-quinone oxidoreductase subunit NuoE [Desulfofalx alkaliphila]|uniref:NADH-quinone oxidoreductase subunit NuoE n=1 Tax=Desulfofalx alkaliphila TaxID=105483 RepID=UPI00068D516E|nr:NADH-quinone oxidoreductase subunit NuoE [Desulfofalx alkaliphila]
MTTGNSLLKDNGGKNPFAVIDNIVRRNNYDKGAAIVILQQVQSTYGYVSPAMIERIAQLTGIQPSELYSIVTFYSQFRTEPVGENIIQVCHGTACHLAGAERISEAIENETGAADGQTSADGKFTVENVACLGCCSHGPVVTINDETYAKVTPESARKLVREKRQGCRCKDNSTGQSCSQEGSEASV